MKAKVHTIYEVNGKRVVGVTTVIGILNKPALMHWAWQLGVKQIDYKKFVDEKAAQGTLAHAMILAHLWGQKVDTADYSKNQIDAAENAFLSYLEWEKGKKIEPMIVEHPMTSSEWMYGGTPDFFGMIDGIPTLLDYKTSKALYDEHIIQVAAYARLIEEAGHEVKDWKILRIGRDEDEGFEVRDIKKAQLDVAWEIFRHCLGIYEAKKALTKGGKS